jgi:hypothetical protein
MVEHASMNIRHTLNKLNEPTIEEYEPTIEECVLAKLSK